MVISYIPSICWHMKLAFYERQQRGALIILETHIAMSSLIFHLVLLLELRFISFKNLTITQMVLIHERTALYLYALVTAHFLIMVIVPHVGMVFLLVGLTLALSLDTWTVHVFSVVVHAPLVQMVRCKRL
jgi:hypothetical protein